MTPLDFSTYLTNLLRSGPEVIVAFIMGALCMAMLPLVLRRWFPPAPPGDNGRSARKVAHLLSQVTNLNAQLTNLNGMLAEASRNVATLSTQCAAAREQCSRLEADNSRLLQTNGTLEQAVEELRVRLHGVTAERDHYARWVTRYEEENARHSESESLPNG